MRALVAFAVACVLISGCADGPKPAALAPSSGPPQGSVAVPSSDNASAVGTVDGRVTDAELQAVANATVGIVDLAVEVRTTVDGLFTFESVPAGRHPVTVTALGYLAQSRMVTVVEGEVAAAVFELESIPISEPRSLAIPNTFFIHFGVYGTSATGSEEACEACNWQPKFDPDPSFIVLEIQGKHTVKYPTRPDGLALFIHKNAASGGRETYIQYCDWINGGVDTPCLQLPMRITYNRTAMLETAPVDKPLTGLFFNQWCDPYWVCFEERYEEWITLFWDTHESEVPADYSAWPK